MRGKRILFLTEYYPPTVHGGGERSCALLAEHLAKSGLTLTVLTSHVPGLPAERTERGVRVIRILRTGTDPQSPLANIRRALSFRRSLLRQARILLQQGKFDAVHCFNMTSLPAVALKEEFPVPFIAHVNSLLFACPKGDLLYHGRSLCRIRCDFKAFVPCLRDCAEIGKLRNSPLISYNPLALSAIYARYFNFQQLLGQFDRVMAISKFLKQRLRSIGIPANRIHVLHNMVDLLPFRKSHEKRARAIPRLLYLGTLSAAKGIPDLLQALERIPGTWHCDIYGTGPLHDAVRRVATHDSRIDLHAPVSERFLPILYRQADLVLFPSRWPEPFGRVAIEAMAAGKPVIATRIGGIVDTVTSHTGILVPPGNPAALATAIGKLLRNAKLRQRLGNAGRKRVQERFAPKALTAQMRKVYASVIR